MSERLYTDEDVELCARAAFESFHPGWFWAKAPEFQRESYRAAAHASLAALARVGWLRPSGVERFQLGDLAATDTKVGGRIEGRVVRLADDGMVTIAVPQGELVSPMEVTASADRFARVEDGAGRLLPADAEREQAARVRTDSGGTWVMPLDMAESLPAEDVEIVERIIGPWVPVSSENTEEADRG